VPFVARTYPQSTVCLATQAIVVATALFVAGCAAQPHRPLPSDVAPFGRNVTVIYVPGIGGYGHDDHARINGLKAGGYAGKAEVWDWMERLGPISALWSHARQRAEARQIADRVRTLRAESPADSVVLVGHSAGTGLVVMALEDLPPDLQVEEVVLLAPALSRTHDLTRALRHVYGRADVFCSERDTLVLALGTFLLGTVDGVHGEAAGHGGFVKPPGVSDGAYAKLGVHPFSNDRRLYGDDGGHEGILAPGVAAALVAPMLPGHELHHETVAQTDARGLP
jgi:pimeloyl-ACP methyl ester carboxylesterase